jgi:glycosyltransferase involved in cell wall biosynthesis
MKRIGADIYICRSAGAYVGKWALFAKVLRKKFIYMAAHDIDCDGTFEKRASFSDALSYRLGLRLADGIVAQNTDQKNYLTQRGLKKIAIIKKGLELSAPNSPVKKRTDVLWVGRCEPWKRPELFIELAHRLPHERFVMICQPARNQDPFFKIISSKAQGAVNLRFFEGLAHDQVESFFQKAKVFVLTSLHEGDLPMVALEALKYEVPVLSLSVNPDDCFTRYGFGLYANGNKRTLEYDLKRLLNDPHLYKQCQKAGRVYFNDFCDLTRVSRQLLECFKQLITNE